MKPLVLSPSRVKTWVRCKKSYHWKYNMHLRRVLKESPLELGSIASEIFATYYGYFPKDRTQPNLINITSTLIARHRTEFLGKDPQPKRIKEWSKIVDILGAVFTKYTDWTSKINPPDNQLEIKSIETTFKVNLVPDCFDLLAIPDSTVEFDGSLFVFEHKLRSRYRTGDFGIDYQSVGSCLVTGAIGTIYNVVNYRDLRLYRDIVIRSEEELDYFRKIYISIGEDILSTKPSNMYPQPFKRCSCSYYELCMAETEGNNIQDVIDALFLTTTREKELDIPEDIEE